ncbi:MAG: hypothetical protein CVT88_00200 [Candidatus Altiarchaeales archaeon HGW-Altiarchaeales-1]|nr:MAG: hypothetical protein CVT88_00200 [Candidatus Altiarchaeales archaeon HGW-Altiarchaeales-1]
MNNLKEVRVLVTGAGGFIGSHLTRRLVNEGAMVSAFEISKRDNINDLIDKIDFYNINLCDFESVRNTIKNIQPEVIYHLAGVVDVKRSFLDIDRIISANIQGTANLLHALEGINYDCFINTGTCEEYGDNPAPFVEEQMPNPVSPYSASKVWATFFCKMLYKTLGCPIITLRPFLTYGPYQFSNMLIPSTIISALFKKEFKLSKGEQTREFNYVSDIVDGFIKASLAKKAIGEIINIGNGKEYRIKDVVIKILDIMGNPIEPVIGALPYRPGETNHFYCDNTKAGELIGWESKIDLDTGLKLTIEWYTKEFKKGNLEKWMK